MLLAGHSEGQDGVLRDSTQLLPFEEPPRGSGTRHIGAASRLRETHGHCMEHKDGDIARAGEVTVVVPVGRRQ